MEVAAVADGLHIHIPLQGHAEDGGVVLVEQAHGVAQMGDRTHTGVHTGRALVVARAAVAHGADDAHGVEAGDQPGHAGDLGGQGGIAHVAAGGLLILGKELRVGGVHQQVLRHGALVLGGEARPLQMDAQQSRPVVGAALDDLSGLLHAPEGLLRRVGEHRAQPAGDALGGEEPADRAQALGVGGVHVHPGGAVGVQVQKTGQHPQSGGVHLRQALLIVVPAAQGGDVPVLHRHVQGGKGPVPQDGAVFQIKGVVHGGLLNRPSGRRWR